MGSVSSDFSTRSPLDLLPQRAPVNPAQPVMPPAGASTSPVPSNIGGAQNAFQQYLDSTGYQFQFDQGQRGITGSAAARGLLNSGATAKALTDYGQNMGKKYFADYLGQLGNMNNTLGGTASAGQNALGQIATAGTAGGGNAANAITQGAANQGAAVMSGGNATANGISGAAGAIGNAFSNLGGSKGLSFFG
jgi:hypothetical protein